MNGKGDILVGCKAEIADGLMLTKTRAGKNPLYGKSSHESHTQRSAFTDPPPENDDEYRKRRERARRTDGDEQIRLELCDLGRSILDEVMNIVVSGAKVLWFGHVGVFEGFVDC